MWILLAESSTITKKQFFQTPSIPQDFELSCHEYRSTFRQTNGALLLFGVSEQTAVHFSG